MPQHYIKIEIKGDQRNLPVKDDLYWVHGKISNTVTLFSFHNNKEVWLNQIDWYFSPEPQQPEQLESAELNRNDLKRFKMFPERAKELTGINAEIYVFTFDQLNELFASQSHNNTVVGPDSDGDFWFKQFNERYPDEVSEIIESLDYKNIG